MNEPRSEIRATDIVQSESFRAVNLLIDELGGEIEWRIHRIKTLMTDAYADSQGNFIRVRTSQEPGNPERELPGSLHIFKDVAGLANGILEIESQINKLQQFKLRLLNDYDFTHGDDSLQRAVFAPATPAAPKS